MAENDEVYLTPRYAPRIRPTPIPASGVFDTPAVCVTINSAWVSHLLGVIEALDQPDTWIGTAEEIDAARQQVNELAVALRTGASCMTAFDIRVDPLDPLQVQKSYDGVTWLDAFRLAGDGTVTDAEAETVAPGQPATATIVDGILQLEIPAGPAGADGAPGAPGPAGPQGLPGAPGADGQDALGIQSTEVINTVSDTPTSMTYNGVNGRLTLNHQAPWLRGVRSRIYEEWVDVGTMPPNVIEMNTYGEPEEWHPLVVIPPYKRPDLATGFEDDPPLTTTDAEVACGMATKIIEALDAQFAELTEKIGFAADTIETIAEMIEWFYASGISVAFQFASDGIGQAFTIGESLLLATYNMVEREEMHSKLYCLILENGGFDKTIMEAFASWGYERYSALDRLGARTVAMSIKWAGVSYWKRVAFLGSLDPQATCVLYDCEPEPVPWCYNFLETFDEPDVNPLIAAAFYPANPPTQELFDSLVAGSLGGLTVSGGNLIGKNDGGANAVGAIFDPLYVTSFSMYRTGNWSGDPPMRMATRDLGGVWHMGVWNFLPLHQRYELGVNAVITGVAIATGHNAGQTPMFGDVTIQFTGDDNNPFPESNC